MASRKKKASPDELPPRRRSTDQPLPPRTVLVTGFPGFIGRRLLKEMLHDEQQTDVVALVEERFLSAARRYLDELPDSHKRRVELLTGDVISMDLGLSGEEFEALRHRITHIFH